MPAAKKPRTNQRDAISCSRKTTRRSHAARPARGDDGRGSRQAREAPRRHRAGITIHSQIEEEIFDPAFSEAARKKDDGKLYFEALEEHHVVDMVLPEIKGADVESEQFAAKAKVLKDLVEHHAEEEETEMFPRARKLMTRDELLRLGAEMAQLKASMTRGLVDRLAGLVGA